MELVMEAIRIPPGSWSEMYASHLPSGDGRPPNAARLSKRGSPPRVGMEYTLDPTESLAVKTIRVSSDENARCERSLAPLVTQAAEPPICCSQICGGASSRPPSET